MEFFKNIAHAAFGETYRSDLKANQDHQCILIFDLLLFQATYLFELQLLYYFIIKCFHLSQLNYLCEISKHYLSSDKRQIFDQQPKKIKILLTSIQTKFLKNRLLTTNELLLIPEISFEIEKQCVNNTLFRKMEFQESQRMKIFTKFTQNVAQYINKQTMEILHNLYYIREFKIWEIQGGMAVNLYFGILTRTKRSPLQKNELGWVENELRLFVWTLVLYTYSRRIDIQDMKQEDWDFFSTLFPNKRKILFEYQASNLMKNHNQYKKWVHEQDELFEQLVKKDEYKLRWSDLGKALFIQSNRKYFRTPKQCRQRWLNHLDPSKLKKFWHEEEDFILIQYVKYFGKKWANISKKLENKRNQHSIKNRFKSLLTKQSKCYLKPASEQTLVDNIYCKFLQNMGKNPDQQNYRVPYELVPNNDKSNYYSLQEKKKNIEIYEQENNQSINHQSKEILCNISLNSAQNQHQHKQNKQDFQQEKLFRANEKLTFEFKKIVPNQVLEEKLCKKPQPEQSQIQKRIRADLFLQQDPFQMLKSYFYKN